MGAVSGGRRRPVGGKSGNVGQSDHLALVSTSLHHLPVLGRLFEFLLMISICQLRLRVAQEGQVRYARVLLIVPTVLKYQG